MVSFWNPFSDMVFLTHAVPVDVNKELGVPQEPDAFGVILIHSRVEFSTLSRRRVVKTDHLTAFGETRGASSAT